MGMPYPIETYAPLHVLTNLVALGQTVCAQSPKTLGAVGRRPLVWGMPDPLETRPLPICHHRYRESGTSIWRSARKKEWRPYVPAFKVNQGHRNRNDPIGYL